MAGKRKSEISILTKPSQYSFGLPKLQKKAIRKANKKGVSCIMQGRKKFTPFRIYVVYLQCDAASSSPRLCAGDESGFSFL